MYVYIYIYIRFSLCASSSNLVSRGAGRWNNRDGNFIGLLCDLIKIVVQQLFLENFLDGLLFLLVDLVQLFFLGFCGFPC